MTTPRDTHVEPSASAPADVRKRFLSLAAHFLAGPVIAMVHFLAVYLPTEALCEANLETEVLGLSVASVVTLALTAVALAAVLVATRLAYRRWRPADGDGDPEPDHELAFIGVLLDLLSIATILFVGLPALALDACLP